MRILREPGSRGIAILEFAIVTPVLLLLLVGALDCATLLRTAAGVADAARCGAQYGSLSVANANDIAGMRTAALNAAPEVVGMAATPVRSCKCSDGSLVSCTASCSGGKMLVYAQVTARATAPTMFKLYFSGAISTTVIMRAK